MSKVKRILSVIMAMVMVLAMSVPTFAAGEQTSTAKIYVKNAEGANVKFVQAVQVNPESTHGWAFTDETYASAFRTAFNVDKNEDAIEKLIDLGKLEELNPNQNAATGTTNTGKKEENTATLASQFATALANITIAGDGTNLPDSVPTTGYELTDTASAGLYVIKATKTGYSYSDMAVYVSFADHTAGSLNNATVTAKGTKDQVKKEIDVVKVEGQKAEDQNTSITTGDVINYTITQSYPYYPANAEKKTFQIVDTITNAEFNQDSLVVKSADTTLVKGTDYKVDYTTNAEGNVMTIVFTYDNTKAGQIVTVKYGVTVKDISAVDNAKVVNSAKATANGKYTVAEVESAAVTFTVKKVDASNESDTKTGLSGAEFQLYVSCAEDATGAVQLTLKDNNKVWALSLGNNQKKTTSADGTATFKGLDANKTYYVLETKAPAGYSLNDKAIQLTGANVTMAPTRTEDVKNAEGTKVEYTKEITAVQSVTNFRNEEYTDTKLSALPSTGGIGTTIFTIGGCAIMIVAAGLFFATRRKTQK